MDTVLRVFNILLPYLAVGAGLTVLTQVMKRIARLEKTTVIVLLFHTLTFLATLATWWANHAMALYTLVLHGTAYSGAASALYPAVRWADGKITSFYNAVKLVKKYEPELAQIVQAVEDTTGVSVDDTPPQPALDAAVAAETTAQKTNTPPAPANF